MTVYEAEINPATSEVVRVIVSPHLGWAAATLGGTWAETSDPYSEVEQVVAYTGPGHHIDNAVPERFVARIWDVTSATVPDELGDYGYTTEDELVWHLDRAWRNLMPTDTANVWEPGVANWREYPMGVEFPIWIQPSGAIDAYPTGFVVEHAGTSWVSDTPANVWEPGVSGWIDQNPVVVTEWAQPAGAQDAYPLGAIVTHNGSTWENTGSDANVWAPGVFGWTVV